MTTSFRDLAGHNAYDVLEISEDASAQEIRDAYRTLVKRWHPDRHLSRASRHEAEERIRLVTRAFEALSKQRAEYDSELERLRTVPEPEDEPFDVWDEAEDEWDSEDDPWEETAYGTAHAPPPPPPPPPPAPPPPRTATWEQRPYVRYPWPGGFPQPRRRPRFRMIYVLPILIGAFYLIAWTGMLVNAIHGSANPDQPQAAIPASLSGTWTGIVTYSRPDLTETLTVTLPVGRKTGQERFPLSICTGILVPFKLDGDTLLLHERITDGQCANDNLRIHLDSPDQVSFQEVATDTGSVHDSGTFTRMPEAGAPKVPDILVGSWHGSGDPQMVLTLDNKDPLLGGTVSIGTSTCLLARLSATRDQITLLAKGNGCDGRYVLTASGRDELQYVRHPLVDSGTDSGTLGR